MPRPGTRNANPSAHNAAIWLSAEFPLCYRTLPMNRTPIALSISAALTACLLFLSGCKTSDKKKEEVQGAETDKEKAKRTAAETAFYAECGKLGERGGTVEGRDGWLFAAGELLQLS